jgi:hypothetical protein
MLLIAIAMAGITYYYHLHEVPDEPDTEDTTSTSVFVPEWHPPLAYEIIFPLRDRHNG